MKPIKAITLILALAMLTAPILVTRASYTAQAQPVYTVQPVAIPSLTDVNASIYGLEAPGTPSAVGGTFNVEIHLVNATALDFPNGIGGVEVHFDFNISGFLNYAIPTAFVDELGMPGGVLPAPQGSLTYVTHGGLYTTNGTAATLSGGVYPDAASYDVVAASGSGWNGQDGLVAIITFKILNNIPLQPAPNVLLPLYLNTTSCDLTDYVTSGSMNFDIIQGTLQLDAQPLTPPPEPAEPNLFVSPATSPPSGLKNGDNFTVSVMINTTVYWDVAGFDINFTYNATQIQLQNCVVGGFLAQNGGSPFGWFYNNTPGSVEGIWTRTVDGPGLEGSGIDSLFTMTFMVIMNVSSAPLPPSALTIGPYDLASWAHPERWYPPWNSFITAVDITSYSPSELTNGTYTVPYIPLGAAIDLYDQYPDPYGGQGANQHSDSFAPQAQVCLYAKVTYAGDRVTNKLVIFEVDNALGQKVTILQNYTNSTGIASVCFRIPMTDMTPGVWDPAIFGWWNITATVEVDQLQFNDTMAYQVGWQAQVTSVAAINAPYHKYTDLMDFTATVQTIHEQPFWVLVSVDSYDVQGYPLNENAFWVYINATRSTCPFTGNTTTTTGGIYVYPNLIQGIPTWARVGTATVIGYAMTNWPRLGGTPYGPQSPTTSFGIIYP
jgi:hypothetical protein